MKLCSNKDEFVQQFARVFDEVVKKLQAIAG
jgi:hypothetical protein